MLTEQCTCIYTQKQQTEPLEKKLTSGTVCTLSESDEYITDDSNLGSANSSLLLDEMDKQKKIIVDLKKKLKGSNSYDVQTNM